MTSIFRDSIILVNVFLLSVSLDLRTCLTLAFSICHDHKIVLIGDEEWIALAQ